MSLPVTHILLNENENSFAHDFKYSQFWILQLFNQFDFYSHVQSIFTRLDLKMFCRVLSDLLVHFINYKCPCMFASNVKEEEFCLILRMIMLPFDASLMQSIINHNVI